MAKKVPITKVLSCFVVFVILMSAFSVAVLATESSNSTASNDSPLNYVNTSSLDIINESVEVPDPNLPVINDTDISTAKTVSSLGYCSYVWIEITDKYCKGYEVYVDGVYQFTEGEDSVPDGYCCFKVTPGYHTFKLTLNGKEVSKGWNCQCGTGYNWMSMNDMIPHWCEGGGNDNPTDEYEVKFRGTVTSTTPSEYDCGFKDVYICEVKIEKVVSGDYFEKGDIVNIVYSQWRENAHVCGTYDKVSVGDTVEVYGEMIPIYCVGTWITICGKSSYYLKKISSESLSISVWTDKSEYKIGETVTINYQTNKKCTAKLTITKPDGGDIVYGPNEIPASTRSKSATAGYPTGKRTVVFEAWAGAEYKKATCYFDVLEVAKKVKFREKIIADYPLISFYSFDIKIDKILEDPTGNLQKGEIVNVYGHRSGPAHVDDVIVGNEVKVFGEYRGYVYVEGATFERIFLSDWGESSSDHYVKIIEPTVWNVKFEGIISKIFNKESSNWYDAEIKVTKVSDDPSHTLDVNEIVNVYRANENAYEDAVSVGDLVEVRAEYNSKYEDSGYALRDWQHHIKKMEVKKPVHNIDTGKGFATIQAAIDDSDTGHTITVDPGTYVENVDVTESVTIKSTSGNPKDTIVQAAVSNQNYQNVFTVTANNVHIDGFTIKGASYFWCSGIWLNSNNCIISNNTFEGNAIGIWIHPPSLGNNIIRNNKFSSSSGYSPSTTLYLEAANNKIYLNNFIIGMEWGSGNVWNSPTQITYEYEGNTFTSHLGNYWDDYRDTDANGDGIWDHPYSIDEGIDYYPLVKGFENYKEVNQIDTINFSGHTWSVRHSSESPQGPGNNYWSNSTENIWVDDEGQLHLKITYNRRNGKWYCPEIFSQESFGYGKYVFYVASRVDNFDENVVGGLFTYEGRGETTPKEYEIDIEFSRWGVETNNNSLHVFQYRIADGDPATDDEPNEIDPNSFNISLNGEYSTHTFVWKNDYLHFQSYHGHYDNLPSEGYLISEKIWEDTRIPPESEEKVHLNLWLVNGNPPSDPEQSVEIIIKKFDVLSISVEGRSEGCEDYAPLNVFFREAKIDVKQSPDKAEHTFNLEWWEDSNKNLFIDESDKWIKKGQISITDLLLPEDIPIGLYRLRVEVTDYVSNHFWVIFNATDSGLSEEDIQNYWKDNITGVRKGIIDKKEVRTSHHSIELMIGMASISSIGYPIHEEEAIKEFQSWIKAKTKEQPGVVPPSDIIEYINQIKEEGKEPPADCDGRSSFLVSLARAAGIPAREIKGFGTAYPPQFSWSHCWVEAFYERSWQIWDPTAVAKPLGFGTDYTGFIEYHKKNRGLIHLLYANDELGKGRGDYWG